MLDAIQCEAMSVGIHFQTEFTMTDAPFLEAMQVALALVIVIVALGVSRYLSAPFP
jgi:hypothetical protein